MCGLGHLFEQQGIATTAISLIRLHAEKMSPPRTLWVPFALGRPFGPPHNAEFQRRVVLAALSLLERGSGPVLEDFPDDEPGGATPEEAWSCPVSFAPRAEELTGSAAIRQALRDEIAALRPWYERALATSGRTTLGVDADALEDLADFIASMFDDELPESPEPNQTLAEALRLTAEDLKAFMFEAAVAQPGKPSAKELDDWFWSETKTGEVLHKLRDVCIAQEVEDLQMTGILLVPLARQSSAPEGPAKT